MGLVHRKHRKQSSRKAQKNANLMRFWQTFHLDCLGFAGISYATAIADAGSLSEENINTLFQEQVLLFAGLQPNRRLFNEMPRWAHA